MRVLRKRCQMSDCTRGCTLARQHQTVCPDQNTCKGCTPRPATHGLLCKNCHDQLIGWLTDAPGQWLLLATTAEPSMAHAMKGDADSVHSSEDGAPTPLNIAAAATMTDLTDILSSWVEMLTDQHNMAGPFALMTRNGIENPQGRQLNPRWSFYAGESVWCDPSRHFEIHAACKWLLVQVERIETCPGIGDLCEELGEVMAAAHRLEPWHEQVVRVKGIECPECHKMALTQHGGSEYVTCERCNAQISPGRYAIWTRMLNERIGA